MNTTPKNLYLISLGCARNRVDSEVMLGVMREKYWTICETPEEADAIVVNTCGFIESAKKESIDTILECAAHKKTNPKMKLVVAGCLTQRYKTQLAKGLPEVDFFIGTDEFPELANLIDADLKQGQVMAKRKNYLYSDFIPRVNTLAKHSAYVKVAEGCDHQCAFCIIPAIRGALRSRPIHSVVKEVMRLVDEGVLEINLIAQDLAAYGRDLKDSDLLELLKALVKVEGLRWIRLLYVYPENISEEFLEFFAREEKIVKYLDIPVQHASDSILVAMKRDVSSAGLKEILTKVRKKVPEVAIRTSVMVGFPGETDDDFKQLYDFVKELKFEHLGCFSYSQEEGTVAGRMVNQIDEKTKMSRQKKIMALQKKVSAGNLKKYLHREVDVLVSGPSAESEFLFEGRLSIQAPEVDGVVYINDGNVQAHTIQRVKISDVYEYDLVGGIV